MPTDGAAPEPTTPGPAGRPAGPGTAAPDKPGEPDEAAADWPGSLELGAAGDALGLGTVADFRAERPADVAAEAATRSDTGRRPGLLYRLGRRVLPLDQPLLHEEPFRLFWLSRLVSQTAQGALLYALLIVVVDRTDATFYNALFVACSIVPAVLFGLPGGLVGDALPRRPLLVGINLLRFLLIFALVAREASLAGIFAATLGLWVLHQFYSPVESATLAALVPRERYAAAQALSNLALTLAQLMGLVILAPLLLKVAGPRPLYAVAAALFFVAAGLAALLPSLSEHLAPGRPAAAGGRPRSARAALTAGWRQVRTDRAAYEALADDVLVGIGMSALVVIMPIYLEQVLGTAKENSVFVFAPAALGLVFGLKYAPRFGRAVGEQRLAAFALVGFAACIGALGFLHALRDLLEDRMRVPLDAIGDALSIPTLVLVAMLLSIPAGFASALVSVAARSLLLDRTPPSARGQVIATQNLLGNLGALVPTLLTGIAADVFGVEAIAVAIAAVMIGGALAAHEVGRRRAVPAALPST